MSDTDRGLSETERMERVAAELARMPNPLLSEWARYPNDMGCDDSPWDALGGGIDSLAARRRLCKEYAWAVPCAAVIDRVAEWGPIVEMGSGAGYWAGCLRDRGVDVIAYDKNPPAEGGNDYHETRQWSTVLPGSPADLTRHADRALLLVWPPYSTPMASDCLNHYRGDRLVYVGEPAGGCTADDAFFGALADGWRMVGRVAVPQWFGVHDAACFYERA